MVHAETLTGLENRRSHSAFRVPPIGTRRAHAGPLARKAAAVDNEAAVLPGRSSCPQNGASDSRMWPFRW
jgi:hypothetical protein